MLNCSSSARQLSFICLVQPLLTVSVNHSQGRELYVCTRSLVISFASERFAWTQEKSNLWCSRSAESSAMSTPLSKNLNTPNYYIVTHSLSICFLASFASLIHCQHGRTGPVVRANRRGPTRRTRGPQRLTAPDSHEADTLRQSIVSRSSLVPTP